MDKQVEYAVNGIVGKLHTIFDSMKKDCEESKIPLEKLEISKEIITDLKNLIVKSEKSSMLYGLHCVLLDILFIMNEGPLLLDKLNLLTNSFITTYELKKKLTEAKKEDQEDPKLNLFDKDGRRITIEEIMEDGG